MKQFKYHTNCVNSDAKSIDNMVDRAREITYRTARKWLASFDEWMEKMGYNHKFHMKNDYHVRYFKSVYRGKPCVYVVHSAIEYIFI